MKEGFTASYTIGETTTPIATGEKITVTGNVTIKAAAKEISGIAVKTAPTKASYTVGDNFDPTGLVITVTYADETTADVAYADAADSFTFAPAVDAALAKTDKAVTVTYAEKTAEVAITVTPITHTITWKIVDEEGKAASTAATVAIAGTETESITKTNSPFEDGEDLTITITPATGKALEQVDVTVGGTKQSGSAVGDDGTWTRTLTKVTEDVSIEVSTYEDDTNDGLISLTLKGSDFVAGGITAKTGANSTNSKITAVYYGEEAATKTSNNSSAASGTAATEYSYRVAANSAITIRTASASAPAVGTYKLEGDLYVKVAAEDTPGVRTITFTMPAEDFKLDEANLVAANKVSVVYYAEGLTVAAASSANDSKVSDDGKGTLVITGGSMIDLKVTNGAGKVGLFAAADAEKKVISSVAATNVYLKDATIGNANLTEGMTIKPVVVVTTTGVDMVNPDGTSATDKLTANTYAIVVGEELTLSVNGATKGDGSGVINTTGTGVVKGAAVTTFKLDEPAEATTNATTADYTFAKGWEVTILDGTTLTIGTGDDAVNVTSGEYVVDATAITTVKPAAGEDKVALGTAVVKVESESDIYAASTSTFADGAAVDAALTLRTMTEITLAGAGADQITLSYQDGSDWPSALASTGADQTIYFINGTNMKATNKTAGASISVKAVAAADTTAANVEKKGNITNFTVKNAALTVDVGGTGPSITETEVSAYRTSGDTGVALHVSLGDGASAATSATITSQPELAGVAIDVSTGKVTWTKTEAARGNYVLTITFNDDDATEARVTLKLTGTLVTATTSGGGLTGASNVTVDLDDIDSADTWLKLAKVVNGDESTAPTGTAVKVSVDNGTAVYYANDDTDLVTAKAAIAEATTSVDIKFGYVEVTVSTEETTLGTGATVKLSSSETYVSNGDTAVITVTVAGTTTAHATTVTYVTNVGDFGNDATTTNQTNFTVTRDSGTEITVAAVQDDNISGTETISLTPTAFTQNITVTVKSE